MTLNEMFSAAHENGFSEILRSAERIAKLGDLPPTDDVCLDFSLEVAHMARVICSTHLESARANQESSVEFDLSTLPPMS